MIFMSKSGLSPENNGIENAKALQSALDRGGDIYIDEPGIYEIADTLFIGDDTGLIFSSGAYVKRIANPDGDGPLLINRGAFTKTYNKNIKVIGMKLICNNVESRIHIAKNVFGLCAHLAFHYVKNLVVRDFETHDLPSQPFAIQVCTFDNILIENGIIEGHKDGIHLGCGHGFTIRNFKFRTYDDPIALNAHDYAISNPELGWIENGVIENCYDLDDESTTGYFCRILAGAWLDYKPGMAIQNSDSVVYNGKIYRADQKVDGKIYTATLPPDTCVGTENADGIKWQMVQDRAVYNCGCRNVVFRDIYLQKKRPIAFSAHFDKDNWSRSYYPNSDAPVQENITFENVYCQNDIPVFLHARAPINNIVFNNCRFDSTCIQLENIETEGIEYGDTKMSFFGDMFMGKTDRFITAGEGMSVTASFAAGFCNDGFNIESSENVKILKA